jgi:hypothetical protein
LFKPLLLSHSTRKAARMLSLQVLLRN